MTAVQKAGERIVRFEEENGRLVGKMEGDPAPVFVEEGTPVQSGETWVCRISESDRGYLAVPLEKLQDEFAKDDEDESVQNTEDLHEDEEYRILEEPRVKRARGPFGRAIKVVRHGRRIFMDEEDEDGFVCYEGKNRLSSNLLDDPMYMVYRSLDGNVLQLVPCEEGGARCVGGWICIDGLDGMVRGDVGCQLRFEDKNDSLIVYLD